MAKKKETTSNRPGSGKMELSFIYDNKKDIEVSITPALIDVSVYDLDDNKFKKVGINAADILSLMVQALMSTLITIKLETGNDDAVLDDMERICLGLADLLTRAYSEDNEELVEKMHQYLNITLHAVHE